MSSLNYDVELSQISRDLSVVDKEIQVLNEKRRALLERKREIEQIIKQKSQQISQNTDVARWNLEKFSWSLKLRKVASDVFGISDFRELQLPCMNTTLNKSDCILIIPTGGGKSLCYQLTAVISSGWTLVISPLISLMEDQVMSMQKLKVDARLLSSYTDKDDTKQIMDDMVNPKSTLKLLYVTPERLAKSKRFMSKMEKAHQLGILSRIAIDEVHCCSQWGHDFRPDYKFLGILKQQFPGVPLLCLTATASTEVLEDIKSVLNLAMATIVFRASFNRPNLVYEVLEKPAVANQCYEFMANYISKEYPGQSGIIYCLSKKDAEEVALELQRRGLRTGFYHADINPNQRAEIHQKWIANKINIVVATIAFGLGIDKPDVRFVIHHSISKSCENYYQESGRCGRDGKPARCILLFRLADVFRISCMVFHERNTLPKLYSMLRYGYSLDTCRRQLLAEIFGEPVPDCNGKCDICAKSAEVTTVDCSQLATELMPELFPSPGPNPTRLTFLKALDKLQKSKTAKSLGFSSHDLERVIALMLLGGLVKEDFHFTPYNTISYLVPSSMGARQLEKNSISLLVALNGAGHNGAKPKTAPPPQKRIKAPPTLPTAANSSSACDGSTSVVGENGQKKTKGGVIVLDDDDSNDDDDFASQLPVKRKKVLHDDDDDDFDHPISSNLMDESDDLIFE